MYLSSYSLCRDGSSRNNLSKRRLTIGCLWEVFRDLPGLYHWLHEGINSPYLAFRDTLKIFNRSIRKCKVVAYRKFTDSLKPAQYTRLLHRRSPLYAYTKFMVVVRKLSNADAKYKVSLCRIISTLYGRSSQSHPSWRSTLVMVNVMRPKIFRRSFTLLLSHQIFAQYCP